MINVFKKIWDFAGEEQGNIKKSIGLGFVNAIFHAFQIYAIFVVLFAVVGDNVTIGTAVQGVVIMAVSIIGEIITQYYSQLQRVHAGYFMAVNKRIQIGDKLKRVPMGYFNQNSLGEITAVSTTTLSNVETTAPIVLVTILGGFINSIVFTVAMFAFDYRIGLLVIAAFGIFLVVTSAMEKKTRINAPLRQKAQENLIEKGLEVIQGLSVIKAFNITKDKNRPMIEAIEGSCQENLKMERAMSPYLWLQSVILDLFSVVIMISSVYFYLNGTMRLEFTLMMIVAAFMIFGEMKSAGSGMATLRLTEVSIDRANELDQVPMMDEGNIETEPEHYNIEFKDVSFGYDHRQILDKVNFEIKENTMTAIVGPSGSGKSTICNLISRFWDVEEGQILIGNRNVKEYSLNGLMNNISMVFQNVYLFEDTIENNIKFGCPDATREQVRAAAEKACCDDFIQRLPEGYETMIGEGGTSLSGGEKQRISIARAILKDSPIVIFDEATANVDPENEDKLQNAIEELTKDKTIIMIAHRLKTVRNANQILVVNDGQIVQQGTHEQLIKEEGIYSNFIGNRKEANSWKLSAIVN